MWLLPNASTGTRTLRWRMPADGGAPRELLLRALLADVEPAAALGRGQALGVQA
jgi:hypothetical protein